MLEAVIKFKNSLTKKMKTENEQVKAFFRLILLLSFNMIIILKI